MKAAWLAGLLALALQAASAQPLLQAPDRGLLLLSDAPLPPPDDAAWRTVLLPDRWRLAQPPRDDAAAWYRIAFTVTAKEAREGAYAVYLPYLYAGGRLFLNGALLEHIGESDAQVVVRWERPQLALVPAGVLRAGRNLLDVHVPAPSLRFPQPVFGAREALQPLYERRLLWMRTVPMVTSVACTLMAAFLLFIWVRRRQEALYGLLGAAALMWGVRTLTFVIEQIPAELYVPWRAAYHGATGGFVVAMTLFAMRFAGARHRVLERALVAYWIAGPLLMMTSRDMDAPLSRLWSGGLIPVALLLLVFVARAAIRQRSWQAWSLLGTLVLAVMAGVHDYFLAVDEPLLAALVPIWLGHRIFLLHHTANLLLLVTVGILVARFVETLDALEDLNTSLEARVSDRERQLQRSYEALRESERERASEEERQRIMRDMHDGLGSQLLTSVSRVERGVLTQSDLLELLRGCIAEMRLALDALAPSDDDFRSALGNFRYRWEQQLAASGISSRWDLDALDEASLVPVHHRLQVLRVLQEALTNIVKHARAQHVRVSTTMRDARLVFEVHDDGCGIDPTARRAGRGLSNMRVRAQGIGALFELGSGPAGGTHVTLRLACPAVHAAA